ncbi:undecaprenyl-diphosphatase [Moorella naiadis]|uniref:undecaprenyl-diphosphatase n=1 Tax=Moorella naiadis (nom. illeg.) TaxID=3093670 RepID=UPI003D9C970B
MDGHLFAAINNLAGHWRDLDLLMRFMALYGPFVLLLPYIYFWFAGRGEKSGEERLLVLKAAATASLALVINLVIGTCYYRPRPFVHNHVKLLIPHAPDSSFPSDHAALAWALTWSARSKGLHYGLMVLSLVIMIARVYVGVHYPADVIGGAVVGIVASIIVAYLWPRIVPVARRLALILP